MNEMGDPSQALARRWFQKAENDLLNTSLARVQAPPPRSFSQAAILKNEGKP